MHESLRRELAFAATLLGLLVAQLDTLVVTAALPRIGADLGGDGGAVGGVTAAYLLAVAITTPLHGRLGDLFGRRMMFGISVALFATGSVACALAPSMPALVAARALQGIGGGGLVVVAISALGQMFNKAELIRRQGWTTAVWAASALAGPPMGGLVAGSVGWRWIFVINVPICALALPLGMSGLPGRPERVHGVEPGGIDLAGAALIAVVGVSIVLPGSNRALATSPIWAPAVLVLAVAAGVIFVAHERRAAAPLLPPALIGDRLMGRSLLATAVTGVAAFGTFTYLPLLIVAATRSSSTTTGLLLLAASVGQLVGSGSFAILARRWPRVAVWGRASICIGAGGLALLAVVPFLPASPFSIAVLVAGLALNGASLGLSMAAYTLLGQTAAPKEAMGSGMAALSFTRQLGGSLGIAVFGWLALLAGGRFGLTAIFATAGAMLLVALGLAPRSPDETRRDPAPVEPLDV